MRLDDIVGVDQADDLGARVGVATQDEVAGARLVAGPGGDVDEADALTTPAVLLHRTPHGRILGVVVDDDHFEVRVVDPLDRLDRLDEQFGRLVVGRDVQRHERLVVRVGFGQRPTPAGAAQDVAHVVDVRDPHDERCPVEQDHQGSCQHLQNRVRGDDGDEGRVDDEGEGRREVRGVEHLTDEVSVRLERHHHDRGDHQQVGGRLEAAYRQAP
jgi:hypothetical protein